MGKYFNNGSMSTEFHILNALGGLGGLGGRAKYGRYA